MTEVQREIGVAHVIYKNHNRQTNRRGITKPLPSKEMAFSPKVKNTSISEINKLNINDIIQTEAKQSTKIQTESTAILHSNGDRKVGKVIRNWGNVVKIDTKSGGAANSSQPTGESSTQKEVVLTESSVIYHNKSKSSLNSSESREDEPYIQSARPKEKKKKKIGIILKSTSESAVIIHHKPANWVPPEKKEEEVVPAAVQPKIYNMKGITKIIGESFVNYHNYGPRPANPVKPRATSAFGIVRPTLEYNNDTQKIGEKRIWDNRTESSVIKHGRNVQRRPTTRKWEVLKVLQQSEEDQNMPIVQFESTESTKILHSKFSTPRSAKSASVLEEIKEALPDPSKTTVRIGVIYSRVTESTVERHFRKVGTVYRFKDEKDEQEEQIGEENYEKVENLPEKVESKQSEKVQPPEKVEFTKKDVCRLFKKECPLNLQIEKILEARREKTPDSQYRKNDKKWEKTESTTVYHSRGFRKGSSSTTIKKKQAVVDEVIEQSLIDEIKQQINVEPVYSERFGSTTAINEQFEKYWSHVEYYPMGQLANQLLKIIERDIVAFPEEVSYVVITCLRHTKEVIIENSKIDLNPASFEELFISTHKLGMLVGGKRQITSSDTYNSLFVVLNGFIRECQKLAISTLSKIISAQIKAIIINKPDSPLYINALDDLQILLDDPVKCALRDQVLKAADVLLCNEFIVKPFITTGMLLKNAMNNILEIKDEAPRMNELINVLNNFEMILNNPSSATQFAPSLPSSFVYQVLDFACKSGMTESVCVSAVGFINEVKKSSNISKTSVALDEPEIVRIPFNTWESI